MFPINLEELPIGNFCGVLGRGEGRIGVGNEITSNKITDRYRYWQVVTNSTLEKKIHI